MVSAFAGVLCVIVIVMYIFIQHWVNPEGLRMDPHYEGRCCSSGLLPLMFLCVSVMPPVAFQVKAFLLGSGQPVWYSPGAEGLESICQRSSFLNPQEVSRIRERGLYPSPCIWSWMGAAWGTRQELSGTGPGVTRDRQPAQRVQEPGLNKR